MIRASFIGGPWDGKVAPCEVARERFFVPVASPLAVDLGHSETAQHARAEYVLLGEGINRRALYLYVGTKC